MRRSFDTVVVGGGLFGKIIARALARRGHSVQCIDNHNTVRGSDPAACLMKPSWLNKLGSDLKPSLALLDELYGVRDLTFKVYPTGLSTTVHWVDPGDIIYPSADLGVYHSNGTVEGYDVEEGGRWLVNWRDSDQWDEQLSSCQNVVIAGGVWTSGLVPQMRGRIDGRWGVAIRVPAQIAEPFINTWAPYRQLVAFNISPEEVWVGDGSAWKDHPTDERIAVSVQRELRAIGLEHITPSEYRTQIGVRPYVKGLKDPCLLEEIHPNVWVATGGAKNGTASAAWAANRLIERLT